MGRLDGRLANKVAVITGAASGIGEGTARRFAEEGAQLVIVDVSEKLDEVAASINETAGDAVCVPLTADVTNSEDIQAMLSTADDRFGGVDIVYNNAGIGLNEGNVRDCPEDLFDRIIDVNLKGVWLGMKYAIPHLEKRGGGSIISTASIAGLSGLSGIGAYCASKGGVIALTRAAAGEWAPKGIRINCICPGGIVTGITGRDPERARENFARIHPLGRAGEPLDIANAALWLASDDSTFVTGQAIVVDGGWVGVDDRYDELTGRDWSQV
jgi:NAD(P)-dependent dehydrogenase (short-subunit alcohol dehydrogenase family)